LVYFMRFIWCQKSLVFGKWKLNFLFRNKKNPHNLVFGFFSLVFGIATITKQLAI
jgi:hypothetical protein